MSGPRMRRGGASCEHVQIMCFSLATPTLVHVLLSCLDDIACGTYVGRNGRRASGHERIEVNGTRVVHRSF